MERNRPLQLQVRRLWKRGTNQQSGECDDISLKDIMKAILTLDQKVDTIVTCQGITHGNVEKVDENLADLKQEVIQNNVMIANLAKASQSEIIRKTNEQISKENVDLKM